MTNPASENQITNTSLITQISEVTVYTNRALITRRGRITLSGQERELVVAGLPSIIQAESVRAGGVGTVGVQLLGVRTELVFSTESTNEKEAELEQQIQELETQFRLVQNELEALHLKRNFVKGLTETAIERFAQTLARQQVGLDETEKLLNFVGEQYNQQSAEIITRDKERNKLDREIKRLRRQLEVIKLADSTKSYNLVVSIEPAGAGDFELEVSYVITQASWIPLYDLRVSGPGDRVNLSYLAEVKQNSGEDWLGVNLILSTAKPGLGTLPPKLDPWYIDVIRPFIPQSAPMPAHNRAGSAGWQAGASLPADQLSDVQSLAFAFENGIAPEPALEIEAQSVVGEVSNEGGVVTFRLNRDSDIPSDGAPHKITIFSDDYPCRTEYIAVPRQVSFAYRQARITNSSNGATLLPGTANIFRDNTFVGTTKLENIAPGQEFKLNLGIDESLKIERDLVERDVDKRLMGNHRRTTYAYRLTITNLTEQEASLRLTEQLPVSRNEQIKVKLNRVSPQIQPGEMGTLEWTLTLLPKIKRELYYQFTIEHPTDLTIAGLNI